jgi:hypothetical protein
MKRTLRRTSLLIICRAPSHTARPLHSPPTSGVSPLVRQTLLLALLCLARASSAAPAQGRAPEQGTLLQGGALKGAVQLTAPDCPVVTDEYVVRLTNGQLCVEASLVTACFGTAACTPASVERLVGANGAAPRPLHLAQQAAQPAGSCTNGRSLWRGAYTGCVDNDGWLNSASRSLELARPLENGARAEVLRFGLGAPAPTPALDRSRRGARAPSGPDARRGLHLGAGLEGLLGFRSSVVVGGAASFLVDYSFGLVSLRGAARFIVDSAPREWISIGGALAVQVDLNLGRVFAFRGGVEVGALPSSATNAFMFAPMLGLALKLGPRSQTQLGLVVEFPLTGQALLVSFGVTYLFGDDAPPAATPVEPQEPGPSAPPPPRASSAQPAPLAPAPTRSPCEDALAGLDRTLKVHEKLAQWAAKYPETYTEVDRRFLEACARLPPADAQCLAQAGSGAQAQACPAFQVFDRVVAAFIDSKEPRAREQVTLEAAQSEPKTVLRAISTAVRAWHAEHGALPHAIAAAPAGDCCAQPRQQCAVTAENFAAWRELGVVTDDLRYHYEFVLTGTGFTARASGTPLCDGASETWEVRGALRNGKLTIGDPYLR